MPTRFVVRPVARFVPPLLLLAGIAAAPLTSAADQDFTSLVNVFVGTDANGHTFPGASVPFGMVAPSPDNADSGWDYTSGYRYRAPRILGFSNTHISGAGINELGDVLLQPTAGTPWSSATRDFASAYPKDTETGAPGYYAVTLSEHSVRIELTATARVAVQRYTFARPGRVQVFVDYQHLLRFRDGPHVTAATAELHAATGEIEARVATDNWVKRETSSVVRFSQPFATAELVPPTAGEKVPRYLLTFDLGNGATLEARVALSTVDVAGARASLDTARALAFGQIRAQASADWNTLLGRIEIDAPLAQRRIFYTALYHALLHPADIADPDGRVCGPAGRVIAARGGHYYSTLSLWDVSRAQFPLLALVAPDRVDGIVQTLLQHQSEIGYLPLFTVSGRENWCMIGNPALPIIAHAAAAGFTGFDLPEALTAMVRTSTEPRPDAPEWAQRDWTDYEKFGYLPFDRPGNGESVSRALEYGWGDDAVARVAHRAGADELARRFAQRAQGYRRLFDPDTRTWRGRDSAGRWRTPFDPLTATSPLNNPGDYTEANAWQYSLTPALHDPAGWIATLGGPAAAGEWLDRFFTLEGKANAYLGQEGLIGQYAHGNEPGHHAVFLYAWTDRPWRGRTLAQRICRELYHDQPDGLPGNDDAGQVSAWYVFATLGFYPVVPASGEFALSFPLVRHARLHLASDRILEISSAGDGTAPSAIDIRLDQQPLAATGVPHATLVRGGRLVFTAQPSAKAVP